MQDDQAAASDGRHGEALARAAALLRGARRVLFITGAGISADSGLPTYRGVSGLYNGELTEDGMSIEAALSGDCFRRRPEITWKYLAQIERNCRGAQPNAAHRTIAEAERRGIDVVVLTQNVDGLHRQAGSDNLIEIHGSLDPLYCPECGAGYAADELDGLGQPPLCRACGEVVRPEIVLFGEALPPEAVARLEAVLDAGFDLLVVIGTTAVFPYIVEPVVAALRAGIPTVEINPARTQLSAHVDLYLPLRAAEAMRTIARHLGWDDPAG